MTVAARMIERMERGRYLGPDGRIVQLGRRVVQQLGALERTLPGAISDVDGMGAMWAFTPFDGSPARADAVMRAALEEGLLLFTAGEKPTRIRLLLPVNTANGELALGFERLGRALARVAGEAP
jgi:acetylornithine aminotransferase